VRQGVTDERASEWPYRLSGAISQAPRAVSHSPNLECLFGTRWAMVGHDGGDMRNESIVRSTWDGESANGMMERSTAPDNVGRADARDMRDVPTPVIVGVWWCPDR
jgi:hypothetical protein